MLSLLNEVILSTYSSTNAIHIIIAIIIIIIIITIIIIIIINIIIFKSKAIVKLVLPLAFSEDYLEPLEIAAYMSALVFFLNSPICFQ
jgi:hypothetical protein